MPIDYDGVKWRRVFSGHYTAEVNGRKAAVRRGQGGRWNVYVDGARYGLASATTLVTAKRRAIALAVFSRESES